MTQNDNIVTHAAQANLPTRYGDFTLHIFRDGQGAEHMAVVAGAPQEGALVRLHSECATGDILGSLRCDCRDQLESALRAITAAGGGIVLYLRGHEGRGMGLANKIRAYALQEQGMDTVSANQHLGFVADGRDYAMAVAILRHFGLSKVRLMTNNQQKLAALADAGITVTERVPLWTAENPHNEVYLATKRAKLGHLR
ncbi:MAG: GTP cyclohydrolase II [Alphaproteobacteria bacterium]|nr:GTP cyclohydrolase II [Alphaproteobacteria bacterium]